MKNIKVTIEREIELASKAVGLARTLGAGSTDNTNSVRLTYCEQWLDSLLRVKQAMEGN